MYEAILFDLDGTLLPMDNDAYTKGYLGLLAREMMPHGYDPKALVSGMWKGVKAMVQNDGTRLNHERFWEVFSEEIGRDVTRDIPIFDRFYEQAFRETISLTAPTPLSRRAVELARKKAEKVVLATNPFFPPVAVKERMGFTGLYPEDFDYVTHYENSGTCKPNPAYYLEITKKLGLDPRRCLMIGNNAEEDIRAAQAVGMDTYLLTDCLIAEGEIPPCKSGTFEDLILFLEVLD